LLPNERDTKSNVKHFVYNDFAEKENEVEDETNNQSCNLNRIILFCSRRLQKKGKKLYENIKRTIRAAMFKRDKWFIACRLTVKLLIELIQSVFFKKNT